MTPTFFIDDGDNLDHSKDDTEMNTRHMICTLDDEQIEAHGYRKHPSFRRLMSPKDQELTTERLRAMSRYGNFPPYHRFGGSTHETAWWRVNELAQWFYTRYIIDHPNLVIEAEKAGYIRDGFLPTGPAKPKPSGRKPTPKPVTLPSRQWGTGVTPSRKKKAD